MLERFFTSDFDNSIVLKGKNKEITFAQLKALILNNIVRIKAKKQNVVVSGDDILPFVVNFFASVFAKKNILLVDEILKLKNPDFDYDILADFDEDYSLKSTLTFPESINEEEILVSLLTSGSSGIPKTIKSNLKVLVDEAQAVIDSICFDNGHFNIATTTTLSHRYGLTYIFLIPFLKHYTILLDKLFLPDDLTENNCILISTPSFLDIVKNHGAKFPLSPKYIFSAGAKLCKETYQYLENSGSKVINIYGSTEAGVISFTKTSDDEESTLFNNVSVRPIDDGTIIFTPYVPEKEVKINDVIIPMPNRKIILKNRTDRLLKIQDKRVCAQSLEDFLKQHDFVNDAFCFKKDEKIACLCALSDKGKEFLLACGLNELKKTLKQYSRKQLEIVPQKWKFIDILPVTKRGKTDCAFIEHLFNINFSFPVILNREQSENKFKFKLYFYPNSNFYNGHFPEYPVTPGVVQLYLAAFIGERCFCEKLTDGQMKRIKFSNIIKAGEIVELELSKTEKNVGYEYHKSEKTFSSGVFSCENIFAKE